MPTSARNFGKLGVAVLLSGCDHYEALFCLRGCRKIVFCYDQPKISVDCADKPKTSSAKRVTPSDILGFAAFRPQNFNRSFNEVHSRVASRHIIGGGVSWEH
jgi:hypothetical protein